MIDDGWEQTPPAPGWGAYMSDAGILCCWKNYLPKCSVTEERVSKKVKVTHATWLTVGAGELHAGR